MSKVTPNDYLRAIRRIEDIGYSISKLSAESKKLRLYVGEHTEDLGYHKPTRDNPVEIIMASEGKSSMNLITILPPKDPKNKDFNVLIKNIPLCK